MKQVILYGHLAKKFGRHHRFDVRTPAEAIRALSANFPDFKAHLLKHNEPGYHLRVGNEYRDEQGMSYPVDGVIKIVPAVGGASAVGRIILGAALIVASIYMPQSAMLLSALGEGALMVAAGAVQSMGIAMTLGGVAQLLFAPPKAQSTEAPENKPSYAFNGPVNTTTQGNPVPVCYGRLMVGSQVISAGISASDIPV